MAPNTPSSDSPPLQRKAAPGVAQGAALAGIFAVICGAWAIDRAWVRGDLGAAAGVEVLRCDELAAATVKSGPVVLQGCAVHLPSASLVLDGTQVVGGYARLDPLNGPSDAMPLLLRVSEPAQVGLLQEAFIAQSLGDPDAWVRDRLDQLVPELSLEGAVLRGRHLDGTDRDHLQLHAGTLTATAAIVADRRTLPSPWPPAGLGSLMSVLAMWGWLRPPTGITTGLGRGDGPTIAT